MLLEYKQMLSTAHRVLDGELYIDRIKMVQGLKGGNTDRKMNRDLYLTVCNHPTNIWLRECTENYMLMYTYYKLICDEYTYRYGKEHGAKDNWWIFRNPPKNMFSLGYTTPVPQAMKMFPECMVEGDTVQAYRNFYKVAKRSFATWKNRPIPTWFKTRRTILRLDALET